MLFHYYNSKAIYSKTKCHNIKFNTTNKSLNYLLNYSVLPRKKLNEVN